MQQSRLSSAEVKPSSVIDTPTRVVVMMGRIPYATTWMERSDLYGHAVMYRVRFAIGFLLGVVCLGVALFALFQLVRGGSCASGGNYVSVRQCPPGTGKWAFILPLAIIGGIASFILGRLRFRQPVAPVPPPHPRLFDNAGPAASPFGALVAINDGQLFKAGSGTAQPAPTMDPLVRLTMLQSLRDSGALSPAEYDQAKAKILAEM
ncbi:SHOCT domain-containing protein [Dactylosporangium sp. NPDC051484]|uniref:SHOCT domain-containing protein n=1 Tax=Dactylosporangium sp. NPDC051484 TaxID=3154942 RepID=UPI00344BACB0